MDSSPILLGSTSMNPCSMMNSSWNSLASFASFLSLFLLFLPTPLSTSAAASAHRTCESSLQTSLALCATRAASEQLRLEADRKEAPLEGSVTRPPMTSEGS